MKENTQNTVDVENAEKIVSVNKDRFGNIVHGLIVVDDRTFYATRRTDGMQIVDDTQNSPKTKKPAWKLQIEIDDDATVVDVNHKDEPEDEWFSEENMVNWYNNEGLYQIKRGDISEIGEIENFDADYDTGQITVEVYHPFEIGHSEFTIETAQ